ncbi:MAG: tetratricopeptide repeat protein [candidate division Zixibacteria bacterium]|nr:tetratricopeptide repeat protein [candidate division Zixibacteria bacterium]
MLLAALSLSCGKKTGDLSSLKADAVAAEKRNDFSGALTIYRQAYLLAPTDRDVLYGLGSVYKKTLMPDSALVYFRRARVLNPNDRAINKELVQLCPQFFDYQCAIDAISALIATGDNEKMYWPILGDLYYRNEDFGQAARYYELLMAEYPNDRIYYLHLSGSYSYLQKFKESNDILLKYIDRFGPSGEALANIAVNYINLKRLDIAEDYFRQSLEFNPDHVPTLINLANVLSSQDDMDKKREALAIYKKNRPYTPPIYNLDSLIPALEMELGIDSSGQ